MDKLELLKKDLDNNSSSVSVCTALHYYSGGVFSGKLLAVVVNGICENANIVSDKYEVKSVEILPFKHNIKGGLTHIFKDFYRVGGLQIEYKDEAVKKNLKFGEICLILYKISNNGGFSTLINAVIDVKKIEWVYNKDFR